MNRPFNKIWKETLIIALCFILLGCFMLMKPEITLTFFSDIIGAFILMLGVFAFYKHYCLQKTITLELAYAIVCTIGALFLFFNKHVVADLIPTMLGIVIIFNSTFKIQYIFALKRKGIEKWYVSLVLTLVKVAIGILLIVNPFESIISITQLIGMLVIAFAFCDVIDLMLIKYYLNDSLVEDKSSINNEEYMEDGGMDKG